MAALTREAAYEALDTIKDPCMGAAGLDLSIIDLGLVGDVKIDNGATEVEVTFTEPGCMFTHRIVSSIQDALQEAGAESVEVTPRWTPLWTEARMSSRGAEVFEEARSRYGETINPSYLLSTTSRMDRADAAHGSRSPREGER